MTKGGQNAQGCYGGQGDYFSPGIDPRNNFGRLVGRAVDPARKTVDIVFDGAFGRFVEVQDADGLPIRFGKWILRPDGNRALRIVVPND